MPKRSSIKRNPEDTNEALFRAFSEAVGEKPPEEALKNPAAVALGRLGGIKGGAARAAKLTADERSAIAKRAAQARWSREPNGK